MTIIAPRVDINIYKHTTSTFKGKNQTREITQCEPCKEHENLDQKEEGAKIFVCISCYRQTAREDEAVMLVATIVFGEE